MLNLDPNDLVTYTPQQQMAISDLIKNRGRRSGKELWDEKGADDIFVTIKTAIKKHTLTVQKVRCAFCESILGYGGVQLEHYAPKGRYPQYLYEPLNLVCSCPVCNGVSLKGAKNTIAGNAEANYRDNKFRYVHPYLDDVDAEIRYRDPFKIFLDYDHSSDRGKLTIDMFHWNTINARMKRFSNLLVWSTVESRRKMIDEILNYKG
jgi:uncharacterized protein (TIGR02646 family)